MFRFLAILFLSAAAASAQQQERKLEDRLLKPDLHQANSMQKKGYVGGKSANVKSFSTGNYTGVRTSDTGTYTTRSFLGIHNPWIGRQLVLAKKANLNTKPGLANMDRKFDQKKYGTSAYSQSDRSTSITGHPIETKPVAPPAKAQGSMNAISDKLTKGLSIDDVREILNKQH